MRFQSMIIASILFTSISATAQKEDYNWCFGTGAGIKFNNVGTPSIFSWSWVRDNFEVNATISDTFGEIIIYSSTNQNAAEIDLRNKHNEVIDNGSNLFSHPTYTNGAIIINNINNYVFFHIGAFDVFTCPFATCDGLFYTNLKLQTNDSLVISAKNVLKLEEPIEEKLSAVKHANGKDWWVLVRANYKGTGFPCDNRFYRFLVNQSGIQGPFIQDVGSLNCNFSSAIGEMIFSKTGEKLAMIATNGNQVSIFDFNRCSGELSNYRLIENQNIYKPYGCEFSPNGNLLYVSSGFENNADSVSLYQYSLADSLPGRQLIWTMKNSLLWAGQLQMAPNNKIYYASIYGSSFPNNIYNQYNQYLGVINHPDSLGLACDFQPFSFYLGDSVRVNAGLPNMPNYSLGALSIYEAGVGAADTITICTEDTTTKGILLGVPAVQGVTYAWQGDSLNYADIAQPFASPKQTTAYVVTLTDTSIKYSCQSRTDTVVVEVKNCTVGIEQPTTNNNQLNICPNPANENIYVSSLTSNISHLTLTDINGKNILHTAQTEISVSHFSKGLYFVKAEFANGQSAVRKLIVQ